MSQPTRSTPGRRFAEWRAALLVAGRELGENVRTRGFWLTAAAIPLITVLAVLVPTALESGRAELEWAVIDRSGWLVEALDDAVASGQVEDPAGRFRRVEHPPEPAALDQLVADGRLFAWVELPADPVAADAEARYVALNLTNNALHLWLRQAITTIVRERRIAEEGLPEATVAWIEAPFRLPAHLVGDTGAAAEAAGVDDALRQWAPVAFVYLLWIAIFTVNQMLLTSTVEEKSNRLAESLLSAVSARALMAGKIVGIAASGLIILSIWIASAAAAILATRDALPFDLGALLAEPVYLLSFVVYFVLGFVFYAALLCGLGAVASNLRDAQNLMIPLQLVLMVPIILMVPIGRDPGGLLAAVLTWVPPLTPFVMMNRAAMPPGLLTYAGTTVLMLASIAWALRLAGRLFQGGLLHVSAASPTFGDVLRLLRTRATPRAIDDRPAVQPTHPTQPAQSAQSPQPAMPPADRRPPSGASDPFGAAPDRREDRA